MATRRHPRSLHQVSHLFLSSSAPTPGPERTRAEAVVWIVAAGRSVNRAHLAAGVAAAFARQGLAVSVCELADNLPNVGYYFGLEPADYLASALDRRALVTGTWNGSVRFASSAASASLASRQDAEPAPASGHIVIGAASTGTGSISRVCAALESSCGAFVTRARESPARPGAILVAASPSGGARAGELVEALRARQPESLLLCLGFASAPRPAFADEYFAVSPDVVSSSQRRAPSEAALFGEISSFLAQRLGSRRRRSAGAVNE